MLTLTSQPRSPRNSYNAALYEMRGGGAGCKDQWRRKMKRGVTERLTPSRAAPVRSAARPASGAARQFGWYSVRLCIGG